MAWPFRRSRAARARRLPSCIACTRATGIAWPSAMSSADRCCGSGMCSAHGSRSPSRRERGVHGEVGRRDVVEIVPGDGERDGHARPHAWAVRRDHGGAADPRRVDEHLAAALRLDERGRRDVRIESLGAGRDGSGRGGRSPRATPRRRSGRTRAAPWRRWSSPRRSRPTSVSAWRTGVRDADRHRERVGFRRVEVEHEMGDVIRPIDAHQRRGDTRSRAGWRTTAASGGRCTARTTRPVSTPRPTSWTVRTQSGVYFGTFFCMKASWPRWTRMTDSGRSSSTGRIRSRTRVEVVDQVPLRRAGAVEERLVEVRQRDAVA